jgi:hypothetical protein
LENSVTMMSICEPSLITAEQPAPTSPDVAVFGASTGATALFTAASFLSVVALWTVYPLPEVPITWQIWPLVAVPGARLAAGLPADWLLAAGLPEPHAVRLRPAAGASAGDCGQLESLRVFMVVPPI